MAASSYLSCLVLFLFLSGSFNLFQKSDHHSAVHRASKVLNDSDEDTLVNYCKLLQAAFFYGQRFADKKLGFSAQQIDYFNAIWSDVFNIPSYQVGIVNTEFVQSARFGEGNHTPFPPASRYHEKNSDPYVLFHIAKEIGMINSQYFSRCPSCVELSTAKINAYLKITDIRDQLPQIWPDTNVIRKISTPAEMTIFWSQLKCLFVNQQISPKVKPSPTSGCMDTLRVRSVAGIIPVYPPAFSRCDSIGKVDTIGPTLLYGKPGRRNALYRITLISDNPCRDTCVQYFRISRR